MVINDLDYLEKSESASEITGGVTSGFTVIGGINTQTFGGLTFGNVASSTFTFSSGSGFELGIALGPNGPTPVPFSYTGGAITGSFTFSTIAN